MQAATSRNVLFLAVALTAAVLAGCADVHQNPASSAVTEQAVASDTPASQATDARSPTNVPF
jgi:DMSO/TMAO reductase YedYZ molybdopterin-dependent catalytic subunit